MKVVYKRTERYVVRSEKGYLGRDGIVADLEDALKHDQRNKAERSINCFRKHGWEALWIEELPRPFRVVLS